LTNVNLRPDKVNQILQSLTIPFAMRSGTIGKLDLKVIEFFSKHVLSIIGEPPLNVDRPHRDHN
jgi:hypothetical protein